MTKKFYSVTWSTEGGNSEQTVVGKAAAIKLKKLIKERFPGATLVRFKTVHPRYTQDEMVARGYPRQF